MARKKKTLYKKRAFLNPDEGMAAIGASVSIDDEPTFTHVNSTLSISDCGETIHLDFDVWDSSEDAKHLRHKRKKAALLRQTINDFLDAVEEGYQFAEKHSKTKKAAEAKQTKERKKKRDEQQNRQRDHSPEEF